MHFHSYSILIARRLPPIIINFVLLPLVSMVISYWAVYLVNSSDDQLKGVVRHQLDCAAWARLLESD